MEFFQKKNWTDCSEYTQMPARLVNKIGAPQRHKNKDHQRPLAPEKAPQAARKGGKLRRCIHAASTAVVRPGIQGVRCCACLSGNTQKKHR